MDQFNAANNVSDRAQTNTERQGTSHCFVDMANPAEANLGRNGTAQSGSADRAGGNASNFISFSDPFEHCGRSREGHNAHQDGGGAVRAEHGHGHHGERGHHGHHGHHEHGHGHEHGGHHDGGQQSDGGQGGTNSGFDLSSLDLKSLSVDQLIALGNAVASTIEYDLAHMPGGDTTGGAAGGGQSGGGIGDVPGSGGTIPGQGGPGTDSGAGGTGTGSGATNNPGDSGTQPSTGGDAGPPPASGGGGSDIPPPPPPTDTTPPPPPVDTPPVTGGLDANGNYTDPVIEMIRPTDPKLANVLVDAHGGMGMANFPQFESLVAAEWTADSTSGTLPTYGSLLVDASNQLVGSAKTEAQKVIQQDLSRYGDGNVSTYVPDTNLLQLEVTDPTLAEAIRNTQISAGLGLMSKAGAALFEEEVVAMVDSDGETHAFPTDSTLLTAASAMQAPGNDALYANVGSQNALGSKGDMIVSTYAT